MIKKFFPLLLILIVVFLTFYKIYTRGLFPFPGDALVSQNFPWYSGGWDGYDSWTTYKASGSQDAIRQHISWHGLTFKYFKENFSIPLWNPYNYSGTPHFGNIQTIVLHPFNLLFVIFPLFNAWIIYIILQLPLAILFTYLFSRSLGLSKSSSLFSGLAFAFSSYFIYWYEIGIVGYSIIWLPIILYSIQNLFTNFKNRYLYLLILASSFCIFAGHLQTAIYVFLISIAFWLFKTFSTKGEIKLKSLGLGLIWIFTTFLFTAVQTLPAIELYINSPLIKSFSKEVFNTEIMPFKNIMALFAPDFFGNPATNNLWTKAYGDGTPNIGALPLFFAIFALFSFKKNEIRFFSILSIIFLLFAVKSPVYLLLRNLSLPILTGTSSVRTMFAFCFGMSILSAYGLDEFIKSKKVNKKTYLLAVAFIITYGIILLSTFLLPLWFRNQDALASNLMITRKNLVIPYFCILIFAFVFFSRNYFPKFRTKFLKFEIYLIIFITIFAGIYQFNKTSAFSKSKNFFPTHPLINWLQNNASINRFYGQGTARFDNNFATYYHIYSAEGYSVFRITRYAELIASQETGKVPIAYNRADAEFSNQNDRNKKRLFDLLGVRYLIAKDDFERDAKINDPDKPDDDVKLTWQRGKFKIYERNKVLPRYFLSSDFIVANTDQEILDKIYDENFDLHTIILEETPKITSASSQSDSVELVEYKPDDVIFKTKSENNTLLFLSDTFYPGWEASVDNVRTNILRADYAFRAVEVPRGEHIVSFNFRPKSFYYGMHISLISIILVTVCFAYSLKKKKF